MRRPPTTRHPASSHLQWSPCLQTPRVTDTMATLHFSSYQPPSPGRPADYRQRKGKKKKTKFEKRMKCHSVLIRRWKTFFGVLQYYYFSSLTSSVHSCKHLTLDWNTVANHHFASECCVVLAPCLTLSLIAPYLMASSSRSALLWASRSSSLASSPCSTRFSSWMDMTEDMAPAAERQGGKNEAKQMKAEIRCDGKEGCSNLQLSLRFLVTISRTRAGRHVGGASGEGPRTVSFFSSDNTLSSSFWWMKQRAFWFYWFKTK